MLLDWLKAFCLLAIIILSSLIRNFRLSLRYDFSGYCNQRLILKGTACSYCKEWCQASRMLVQDEWLNYMWSMVMMFQTNWLQHPISFQFLLISYGLPTNLVMRNLIKSGRRNTKPVWCKGPWGNWSIWLWKALMVWPIIQLYFKYTLYIFFILCKTFLKAKYFCQDDTCLPYISLFFGNWTYQEHCAKSHRTKIEVDESS